MPIDLERINREVAEKLGLHKFPDGQPRWFDADTPEGFDVLTRVLLDKWHHLEFFKNAAYQSDSAYGVNINAHLGVANDNHRIALLLAAHRALCGGGE